MRHITCTLATIVAAATAAFAQPTTFTYQGFLTSGGSPANGLHDFRFRLFDAPSGGSQIGQTQCVDSATIADGLFTTRIDFGQQFVTIAARYLEIQVRAEVGQPCTDDFGYVLLSPRQQLTATPLASHAKSAFSLDAADGSPASAVFVDNAGSVGIGTLAPAARLHLLGGDLLAGASGEEWIFHTRSHAGGDFLHITDSDNGAFQFQRGLTLTENGNVGIGTVALSSKLEVRGNIRLGPSGQFLAASGEENLRIVRGVVDWNGSILAGSGFVVSHSNTGQYTITFNTPFAGTPSVTATANDFGFDNEQVVMTDGVTSGHAKLVTRLHGEGLTSMAFHFTAIGPR